MGNEITNFCNCVENDKAKDGTTKYYTEIVADTIEFLTPKEDQVARDVANKQVRYEIQ